MCKQLHHLSLPTIYHTPLWKQQRYSASRQLSSTSQQTHNEDTESYSAGRRLLYDPKQFNNELEAFYNIVHISNTE